MDKILSYYDLIKDKDYIGHDALAREILDLSSNILNNFSKA